MSRIILIEEFQLYERIGFYTLRDEEREDSETDLFIQRFFDEEHPEYKPEYRDCLEIILEWIDQIGKRGLEICSLRPEDEAKALPPYRIFDNAVKELETSNPPLRLYCIVLSDNIVVLCGGGIKTSQRNEDSPGIMQHFRFAKKAAKLITKKMNDDIQLDGIYLTGDLELWM